MLKRYGSPEGTETALMSVARFGRAEWLRSLLEAGADVNRKDIHGDTALMKAAAEGHSECLEALVDAGADLKSVNEPGWDVLMEAASAADELCVSKLIEAGSNVTDDIMVSFLTLTVSFRGAEVDPYQVPSTYRCIQQFLKIGAYINRPSPANALEEYITRSISLKGPIHMLLLAAGETIGEKIKQFILKDYMEQEDQDKFSLKHLSREAVRRQMITTHPHDNLFQAVDELNIPSTLKSYMVYDMYLDDDNYSDDDFHDFYWEYVDWEGIEYDRRRSHVAAVLAGGDPELDDEDNYDDDSVEEEEQDEEEEAEEYEEEAQDEDHTTDEEEEQDEEYEEEEEEEDAEKEEHVEEEKVGEED